MCLPYSVEELRKTVDELQESHLSLETTKEALVKSEKLASMGQLAAGIAHEVNNPLGILLLHANLLLEDCEDDPRCGRRRQAHRRPGQPLQEDHLRPAQLRPPEPGRAPADGPHQPRRRGHAHAALRRGRLGRGRRPPRGPDRRARRRPDRPGAHQPAHQRPARHARRRHDHRDARRHRGERHRHGRRTRARASPRRTSTSCSARSSRPSRSARAPGLGLAVTHGIVKMHRGQITVESNADPAAGPTGTTFTISLPRLRGGDRRAGQPAGDHRRAES